MRTFLLILALSSCISLPFLAITGCDPEDDAEGKGCDCIVDEDDANPPSAPSGPTCGESLCPTVSASCDGYCESPLTVADPDALTCALTALRDRTPGIVGWSATLYEGQFQASGYLLIHEDGTAVRRGYGPQDLTYVAEDAVLGTLQPPEHYDACLTEPDEEARFECLRGELMSQTEVCDSGWSKDTL